MAMRFGRFRARFSGLLGPPTGCGHSHAMCVAMKLITLLLLACGALAMCVTEASANSFVEFDFNVYSSRLRNSVFLELYDDRPITVANFLQYVNANAYNNSMMQNLSTTPGTLSGGGFYPKYFDEPAPNYISLDPGATVDLDYNYGTPNPTIVNEFNNAPLRSNVEGTIAMYHDPSIQNSQASSRFFFNLSDNTQLLDGSNGQAVFGRIAGDGLSLIDAYANSLPLINLNPDYDDNGTRDVNYPSSSAMLPFSSVPILVNQTTSTFVPLIVNTAKAIDYLGTGSTTTVPAGGLAFTTRDVFLDTGGAFTGTGSITIGNGRKLGMRENYALNRDLLNHGALAPGLSLGVVGVQGSYYQYSDGLLNIQLAGTTVDTQYDKLICSGTAFLAGRLQVQLLQNFVPVAGNTFNILSAQSVIGTFTSFDLPQLTAGLVWDINQTPNAVSLFVAAADFNKDGVVDGGDYAVWRKKNGSASDYQLWRTNVGNRSGGVFALGNSVDGGGLVGGTVPEPSAVFLMLAAGVFFGSLRRHHIRA